MTNKEFFAMAMALTGVSQEFKDKAKALLDSANKKSESKSQASKFNAQANFALAQEFAKVMKSGVTYACSEVKALTGSTFSPAKMSTVMKAGVDNGLFTSVEGYKVGGKGRPVKGYSLAVAEDSEDSEESEDSEDFSEDVEGDSPFDSEDFEG